MKAENCELYGPAVIARQVKFVTEPGFVVLVFGSNEARVLRCTLFNRFQGSGYFLGVHEVDDSCLGVAPGEVRQELTNGLMMALLAPPELAFGNKHILAFMTHQ